MTASSSTRWLVVRHQNSKTKSFTCNINKWVQAAVMLMLNLKIMAGLMQELIKSRRCLSWQNNASQISASHESDPVRRTFFFIEENQDCDLMKRLKWISCQWASWQSQDYDIYTPTKTLQSKGNFILFKAPDCNILSENVSIWTSHTWLEFLSIDLLNVLLFQ